MWKNPNFVINDLKTEIDLHNIGVKARNRKHWKIITNSVVEAAYSDTATYDPTTGNSGDDELL